MLLVLSGLRQKVNQRGWSVYLPLWTKILQLGNICRHMKKSLSYVFIWWLSEKLRKNNLTIFLWASARSGTGGWQRNYCKLWERDEISHLTLKWNWAPQAPQCSCQQKEGWEWKLKIAQMAAHLWSFLEHKFHLILIHFSALCWRTTLPAEGSPARCWQGAEPCCSDKCPIKQGQQPRKEWHCSWIVHV